MPRHSFMVPITLDRERQLRLTPKDMDDVLDALRIDGGGEVMLRDFLVQLGGLRRRAYITALWAGLRHEDSHINNRERAGALFDRYIEDGGDLAQVTIAIKRAMVLSGAMPFDLWTALAQPGELAQFGSEDPRKAPESVT